MSEQNLANQYRPKLWSEYIGQGNGTGGAVDTLKSIITDNLHSKVRAFLISGDPGCGKTTLATMYSRATLCYNRKPGECEPCGECAVCLGEDLSNIHHYTISSPSEAREKFRSLIELSNLAPNMMCDDPSKFRRFIIIDEFELASSELAAMLLDPIEYSPETTTWIIISMDLEKLAKRDPAVKEAIESRCAWLPLSRLSNSSIANKLCSTIELDYNAGLAIAQLSEGNMRRAWNTLSMLLILHKPEELTEEIVFSSRLGNASAEARIGMWEALAEGKGAKVKEIVESWLETASDIKLLGQLLQKDIIDNLVTVSIEVQSLLAAIGRWQSNSINYPLTTVLMSFLGTKVLPTKVIPEVPKKVSTKSIEDLVNQQLTKVKVNTQGIPPLLACSSLKGLLLHYVM